MQSHLALDSLVLVDSLIDLGASSFTSQLDHTVVRLVHRSGSRVLG